MCNVAQIMTAVLLVNAMIGASNAFFFAKMLGPSRELEAACPGTCQVRFKQKNQSAILSMKFIPILVVVNIKRSRAEDRIITYWWHHGLMARVYNLGRPLIPYVLFSFGNSGYQFGCTIGAVRISPMAGGTCKKYVQQPCVIRCAPGAGSAAATSPTTAAASSSAARASPSPSWLRPGTSSTAGPSTSDKILSPGAATAIRGD